MRNPPTRCAENPFSAQGTRGFPSPNRPAREGIHAPAIHVEVNSHRSGALGAQLGKRAYLYASGQSTTPSSTTDYAYVYDPVGNVWVILASDGHELCHFTQDAFGNELSIAPFNGTSWQTARNAGITEHQTGKWLDPFTGLYYFSARWYDSGVGRFVGRSLLQATQEAPYRFVDNIPTKLADYNGLEGVDPIDQLEGLCHLICLALTNICPEKVNDCVNGCKKAFGGDPVDFMRFLDEFGKPKAVIPPPCCREKVKNPMNPTGKIKKCVRWVRAGGRWICASVVFLNLCESCDGNSDPYDCPGGPHCPPQPPGPPDSE